MEEISDSTHNRVLDQFRYTYTLENTEIFAEGEFFQVPKPFSGSKSKNIQWTLRIAPKFKSHAATEVRRAVQQFRVEVTSLSAIGTGKRFFADIQICLYPYPYPHKHPVELEYRLSLTEAENRGRNVDMPYSFSRNTVILGKPSECTAFNDRALKIPVPSYIGIACTITIYKRGACPLQFAADLQMSSILHDGHKDSLKGLLGSGDFADITIVAPDGMIPAHKALLAASSPVFRAMFSTDMLEKTNNHVNIQEFNKDTILGMLQYMYTGKCDQLGKNLQEMLHIADKYEVDGLRKACTLKLVSDDIKVENVIQNLLLSDRYNLKELKKVMIQFFRLKHLEIAKCANFKEFVKTNLDLYMEVMKIN